MQAKRDPLERHSSIHKVRFGRPFQNLMHSHSRSFLLDAIPSCISKYEKKLLPLGCGLGDLALKQCRVCNTGLQLGLCHQSEASTVRSFQDIQTSRNSQSPQVHHFHRNSCDCRPGTICDGNPSDMTTKLRLVGLGDQNSLPFTRRPRQFKKFLVVSDQACP